MRRLFGLAMAVPLVALAVALVATSAGSTLEKVYFAAWPGLWALRLALGKGRAPGFVPLALATTLGALVAGLLTGRGLGDDQPYPWFERARFGVLLAGVACLPLAVLLPFRSRGARALALCAAAVLYGPVAFVALQVHRAHVRPLWIDRAHDEPRRLEVEAPDGAVLRGWVWDGRTAHSPLVVLLHGIGASRADLVELGRVHRARGWQVAMFDGRGHGESDSMTTSFGLRERADVRAIVERLTAGRPGIPVALQGCSMGAAVALQAAAELRAVRAVVAEASFLDLETMARAQLAWLPSPLPAAGLWIFRRLAPLELGGPLEEVSPATAIARRRDLRTLLVVDGDDHVIPPDQPRRLHRLAAGRSRLWEVPHASHCAAWAVAPTEYPRRVTAFLDDAFARAARPDVEPPRRQ